MYASKEAGRNRTYWHDGRAIHPVIEQSAANRPAPWSRTTPSQPEQEAARPAPRFPAPDTTENRGPGEPGIG